MHHFKQFCIGILPKRYVGAPTSLRRIINVVISNYLIKTNNALNIMYAVTRRYNV